MRPRLFRIFLHVAILLERMRQGVLYFAAGTMRLEDFRAEIGSTWAQYNTEDEEIDSGLFGWEQALVERFIKPGDRILLVGCGTGRDLVALARMGCQVTGIEPSPRAVARARRLVDDHRLPSVLIEGFFEDVTLDGVFDVVIFSNMCISYVPESRRRIEVLKKARAGLVPGGRVITSFPFRQRPPMGRPVKVGRFAGALWRSDWRLEQGDNCYCGGKPVPIFYYEHIFGPGEIEKEAEAAGLRVAGRGGHPHEEPFVVFTPE